MIASHIKMKAGASPPRIDADTDAIPCLETFEYGLHGEDLIVKVFGGLSLKEMDIDGVAERVLAGWIVACLLVGTMDDHRPSGYVPDGIEQEKKEAAYFRVVSPILRRIESRLRLIMSVHIVPKHNSPRTMELYHGVFLGPEKRAIYLPTTHSQDQLRTATHSYAQLF